VTCRAIFAVNEEGVVTYKEIVPEITEEPNYDAALAAVK
jgi:thiol peroxidase